MSLPDSDIERIAAALRSELYLMLSPSQIRSIGRDVSLISDDQKRDAVGDPDMTLWQAYNAGIFQMGEAIVNHLVGNFPGHESDEDHGVQGGECTDVG